MKLKLIAGISLVGIFLLFVAGKSLYLYVQAQKDVARLTANAVTSQAQADYYHDALGREAARTHTMENTVNELKNVLPDVYQAIKELKIKPARVEAYTETCSTVNKDIAARLRDTTIIINNVVTPVKYILYRDAWYTVSGMIQADSAKLHINSTDTIIQVVSKGERLKPWLFFFSSRQLIQTVQSRNPSNHIVYSRYIKIKK